MKNSKIKAIVKNEVERSIKNKWFVILNIILLVSMCVGLNIGSIKDLLKNQNIDFSTKYDILVEDKDNLIFEKIKNIEDEGINSIEKIENAADYENENIASNIIVVKLKKDTQKYIDASIISKEAVEAKYIDMITDIINSAKDTMVSENKNLTKEEISNIKNNVNVERILLGENVKADSEENYMLKFLTTYLIFFVILLCLTRVANTISQEKLSKSIEYILTSITAKEYMISKVLSVCITVVIQFIFTVVFAIISVVINVLINTENIGVTTTNAINVTNIVSLNIIGYVVLTLVFMCLTTFLLGIIQAVLSSKTTNSQESGNTMLVLVILNMFCYMFVLGFITPDKSMSTITYVLSVIPVISMYFIPSLFLIGQTSAVQIIIALVLLIVAIPVALKLTQKQFRNSILDFIPKHDKKFDGIEIITKTREYQEKLIERKENSKKGMVIGLCVILLLILQVFGGIITSLILPAISNAITSILSSNIYLILSCIVFVISLLIPYMIIKSYMPKDKKIEQTREEKEKDIIKCVKYIFLSIPIMSMIEAICSFAIENMGLGVNITDKLGLFNYSGKLATFLMFLEIAVLPAIFEELFIRKGVFGVLKSRGVVFASIVSSVIFATIHLNLSQFVFAFLVGILFAVVRVKTNKIYPTMILHFINNGVALIQAIFYNHMTFMQIFTYLNILVNAIGFCILIYIVYKKFMELKDKEKIQELKEALDYRKIKLNLFENMYVIRDFSFIVAAIACSVIFVAIEKILRLI